MAQEEVGESKKQDNKEEKDKDTDISADKATACYAF